MIVMYDFGKATTFSDIYEKNSYFGGIIAPVIKISMDALYSNASKLPKIEIEKPINVIGQSTVEGMQSGVYYGYVSQVDGIVKKMKQQKGDASTVIATGGLASLIARDSETIQHVEPHLTLQGLYIIYQKNMKHN